MAATGLRKVLVPSTPAAWKAITPWVKLSPNSSTIDELVHTAEALEGQVEA